MRLVSCLLMVFVPAAALGATFPMAIRWFASEGPAPARTSGMLYALNTAGAAVGAMLAGFVLIPAVGVSGTTYIGIAASLIAALGRLRGDPLGRLARNRRDGRWSARVAAQSANRHANRCGAVSPRRRCARGWRPASWASRASRR